MTTPPRYRTDYRLWLAVAGCVFVALGFFDLCGGGGKDVCSLWARVADLVTHYYHGDALDVSVGIAVYAAVLAGAAALVGWAVQAVVVVIQSRRTAVVPPT